MSLLLMFGDFNSGCGYLGRSIAKQVSKPQNLCIVPFLCIENIHTSQIWKGKRMTTFSFVLICKSLKFTKKIFRICFVLICASVAFFCADNSSARWRSASVSDGRRDQLSCLTPSCIRIKLNIYCALCISYSTSDDQSSKVIILIANLYCTVAHFPHKRGLLRKLMQLSMKI